MPTLSSILQPPRPTPIMHAGRLFSPSSSIVPSHISYDATPSPIMLSNRLVVSPESMFMSLFAYEAYYYNDIIMRIIMQTIKICVGCR